MSTIFSSLSGFIPPHGHLQEVEEANINDFLNRQTEQNIQQKLKEMGWYNQLAPTNEHDLHSFYAHVSPNTDQTKKIYDTAFGTSHADNLKTQSSLWVDDTPNYTRFNTPRTAISDGISASNQSDNSTKANTQPAFVNFFTGLYDLAKNNSKKWVFFPLFFLIALYKSKQENLQVVNVLIKTSNHPKIFKIGMGVKDDIEVSISFEVEKGHPIRFLHARDAEMTTTMSDPIFNPGISMPMKLAGPLKHFAPNRKEFHTTCNICIEDIGNPELKNGPKYAYVQISEREGFYILHFDPTANQDISDSKDFATDSVDTEWASLETISITVSDPISPREEHRTQLIPLSFTDTNGYLRIEQWQ